MGTAGVHFSDRSHGEQEQNGVQTGLNASQLAELLEKLSSGWKESNRLDVQVLRAICRLSVADPEQATDGFSAMDVALEIGRLRRHGWSDCTDKDRVSDDVRRQWNKLLELWPTKEEGVRQALCDVGADVVPLLNKVEGGGAGRVTRYRIEWGAANAKSRAKEAVEPETFGVAGDVRYVCEDIQDARFFVRVLGRGYRLEGWRRGLLLGAVISSIVVFALILVLVLVQMLYSKSGADRHVWSSAATLFVFGIVFWSTTGRILRLADRKIVVAPWWMQSVHDDRLLERREPPRFGDRSIKAVRYATTCPICAGKITVKTGGLEFWGRLVGRCEHSPVEHVFSFDHVTRNGRYLRSVELRRE